VTGGTSGAAPGAVPDAATGRETTNTLQTVHVNGTGTWLDTIGRIFSAIPDLATPREVQSALREILEDPGLHLYWWDWERRRYVDVRGLVAEPAPVPGAMVTPIEYPTRKIGAMLHRRRLLEAPEFLGSFVPMIRIAMERDRLHRDLVDKLEQLRASRLRIVRAGDEERRRLERNLHDGAQQRLTASLFPLRVLRQKAAGDEELEALVDGALTELEGAIADLRELARGLHPPLLQREGLAAALQAGANRSTVPVELELRLPDRLSPELEAAAYYVCSEAATNTVKHAQASQVWLSAVQDNGTLTVIVRDDGIGGACVECGEDQATGLGGLRDRVEALGGILDVVSPEGEGTLLTATFPLR
jgi:signal transduction histidine kinase